TEMLDLFLVAGEESGDRLGAALVRALRGGPAGGGHFSRGGGRGKGGGGGNSVFSVHGLPLISVLAAPPPPPPIFPPPRFRAASREFCGSCASPPRRWSRPVPTRWSSSTVQALREASHGACARPIHRSQSSSMFRLRSGLGVRGGRG